MLMVDVVGLQDGTVEGYDCTSRCRKQKKSAKESMLRVPICYKLANLNNNQAGKEESEVGREEQSIGCVQTSCSCRRSKLFTM